MISKIISGIINLIVLSIIIVIGVYVLQSKNASPTTLADANEDTLSPTPNTAPAPEDAAFPESSPTSLNCEYGTPQQMTNTESCPTGFLNVDGCCDLPEDDTGNIGVEITVAQEIVLGELAEAATTKLISNFKAALALQKIDPTDF